MFVGCPIFVRQGRGVLNTPHKTTRKGRSDLSIGRHIYPCGIHVGRMQYAPTLPAGDISYLYPQRLPRRPPLSFSDFPFSMYPCRGVLHTPYKRPGRGEYIFVGCPIFVRQGRGVLNTPHKTTRQGRIQDDGKGQIFTGRRIQHERRGRCPLAPTSFSCLDTRKGCEKKIKASGMPANLAGYLIFSLFIFRFLLSRVGAY